MLSINEEAGDLNLRTFIFFMNTAKNTDSELQNIYILVRPTSAGNNEFMVTNLTICIIYFM